MPFLRSHCNVKGKVLRALREWIWNGGLLQSFGHRTSRKAFVQANNRPGGRPISMHIGSLASVTTRIESFLRNSRLFAARRLQELLSGSRQALGRRNQSDGWTR